MQRVIQAALIVAGLIHFLPVAGVIGAHQLESMYALPFDERNLAILMRHRAVMLGLLGGFVTLRGVPAGFAGSRDLPWNCKPGFPCLARMVDRRLQPGTLRGGLCRHYRSRLLSDRRCTARRRATKELSNAMHPAHVLDPA